MSVSDAVIDHLHVCLHSEPDLAEALEQSLAQARESGRNSLTPELFSALRWPTDIGDYADYLRSFQRWVPHQSVGSAWKNTRGHAQEVDDRIAHFFFLVSQKVDGRALQDSATFRSWMTEFSRQWGSFLDTPESFSPEALQSFINDAPEYRIEESMIDGVPNAPSGWLTANQFIAREVNGGLRPIAEADNNSVLTSPADCMFKQAYAIDADSKIPATTIKNGKYGDIKELLRGSEYSDSFAGGSFVHYMLPVRAYHRFHLPVAGQVKESFRIHGQVYMRVDVIDGEFASTDSATTGYEFFQTRGVVVVDTSQGGGTGDLGMVAVIPVGMAHVSSVSLTAVAQRNLAKGEEFGYFQFGGSDIIILLQESVQPRIDTSSDFRLVGSPIIRCGNGIDTLSHART